MADGMVERMVAAMRATGLDCENWPQDVMTELASAAIEAMRDLPGEPGPRYTAGEYSRRNVEALIDDALGTPPA